MKPLRFLLLVAMMKMRISAQQFEQVVTSISLARQNITYSKHRNKPRNLPTGVRNLLDSAMEAESFIDTVVWLG